MIKAILFDMDGVLIEAKDWHYDALNDALGVFGYKIGREAHLSTFDGLPTRKKLEMLSHSRQLPVGLHEFINALKQANTIAISSMLCRPVFNHQFALAKLKEEGYLMSVCSNSVRNSVETMMKLSRLDQHLDYMVSNEDVAMPKPDPEMYTKAINHFSLKPEECLVVEDNENGIKAARASGAHVMIVSDVADVNYNNIKHRIAEIETTCPPRPA